MKKSIKDLKFQFIRVLQLADELGGKYKANAKRRVDVQYFAQIFRKANSQHGFGLFEIDTNEKREVIKTL